ncbi:MAG: ATP-binding cassette domain-containing protein [Pseudomonadales bacterium]|nr:ATP-binding cassette domain-containing protein [Pseudomonadales bacterium]
MNDNIVSVRDLKVHFPVTGGILRKTVGWVPAVDGVSFDLKRGETFSLVGESGCGKSTTALAVLRMQPVTDGQIIFEGTDITNYTPAQMRPIRRGMQMVYQDPFGSLNPRMKVGDIIGEPLVVHGMASDRKKFRARIRELMDIVGLLPDMADRYPHEFSGGQRQRIGIARALALDPSLIICDEPVSALDVSIQAQVVNLLMDLQKRLGLTYLFIAHDLSVVRHISNRIGVMYLGKLVELADRDSLFDSPKHPYTRALLDAVPVANPVIEAERPHQLIEGEVPSVRNPPPGCPFHPRCPEAMDECRRTKPDLIAREGTMVACHLYTEDRQLSKAE